MRVPGIRGFLTKGATNPPGRMVPARLRACREMGAERYGSLTGPGEYAVARPLLSVGL